MYYTKFDVNMCSITILGDEDGINRIHLEAEGSDKTLKLKDNDIVNDDFFSEARKQLTAYFNGDLQSFNLKLNPVGSEFQKSVWQKLMTIPYGETRSYKEIAILIGNEKASRAVGMANGKNPIPIIVPCHRVIGSNGKLTGYAFGVELKNKIIDLESMAEY